MILSTIQSRRAERASSPDPRNPIAALLDDATVTEIMINGLEAIYVERGGQVVLTDREFDDENHLLQVIEELVAALGRSLDPATPILEGRLPDGSRLTVALPPVAVDGPLVTIRKFSPTPYQLEDLIRFGSISVEAAGFLRTCVMARANLLICGGSSAGKSTLLNVLSSFIGEQERIVTVEDAAELRLQQDHVCRLESPVGREHAVPLRELVKLAVRMRPDRIVVGEVRGAEALDMLQALNTGHAGAMTTIHANGPRDALSRLETLCLLAGVDLPLSALRRQIVSAVDVVIHLGRLADGSRRVVSIVELAGIEGQMIAMQEIFVSEIGEAGGSARGGTRLMPTGIRPRIMDRAHLLRVSSPEVIHLFPDNHVSNPIDARRATPQNSVGSGRPAVDRRRG